MTTAETKVPRTYEFHPLADCRPSALVGQNELIA